MNGMPLTDSRRAANRRLTLITVDQGVAGASNVIVTVLAARMLPTSSFGYFGLLFLVYTLLQGVSRAIVGDPLLVHPDEAERRPDAAVGAGVALGLGLGSVALLCAGALWWWNPAFAASLALLGVAAPLLVLQDLGRYLGFATRRPSASLVLDTLWLVLVVVGVVVLAALHAQSLFGFIAVWAGTGALAGMATRPLFGVSVRPDVTWVREKWFFAWRYLVSYASTQGGALVGGAVIVAVAGARALGGIQGALLLVRPFMTVQSGAIAAGVSDIARASADPSAVRRRAVRISLLAGGLAGGNAAVILLMPSSLGRLVLGDSWAAAQPLLAGTSVQILVLGLVTGARSGLLGLRAIDQAMRIDVPVTFFSLLAVVTGVVIAGAQGAVWGNAGVQIVSASVWWAMFWRYTGRPGSRRNSRLPLHGPDSATLGDVPITLA